MLSVNNLLLSNKTPPYIRACLREWDQNVVVREAGGSRLQVWKLRRSGSERQCRYSDEFDNLS